MLCEELALLALIVAAGVFGVVLMAFVKALLPDFRAAGGWASRWARRERARLRRMIGRWHAKRRRRRRMARRRKGRPPRRRRRRKHRPPIAAAVALTFVAIVLGVYAAQLYLWRAPTRVTPMTFNITTVTTPLSAGEAGTIIHGSHPTESLPADPARDAYDPDKKARILLQENCRVVFYVADEDVQALTGSFSDLVVAVSVYATGENASVPRVDLRNLVLVVDNVAQAGVENTTVVLDAARTYDCVLDLDFVTAADLSPGALGVKLQIRAVEV